MLYFACSAFASLRVIVLVLSGLLACIIVLFGELLAAVPRLHLQDSILDAVCQALFAKFFAGAPSLYSLLSFPLVVECLAGME